MIPKNIRIIDEINTVMLPNLSFILLPSLNPRWVNSELTIENMIHDSNIFVFVTPKLIPTEKLSILTVNANTISENILVKTFILSSFDIDNIISIPSCAK